MTLYAVYSLRHLARKGVVCAMAMVIALFTIRLNTPLVLVSIRGPVANALAAGRNKGTDRPTRSVTFACIIGVVPAAEGLSL
jgi:hypothetical protein